MGPPQCLRASAPETKQLPSRRWNHDNQASLLLITFMIWKFMDDKGIDTESIQT